MPRVPAHQVTTRNLGAAYPFIAEAGLGQRGVVIGDDLLGGSFVFDPFELYAAGVVSNPNMVGFHRTDRTTLKVNGRILPIGHPDGAERGV